jgi:hypothetical protein
MRNEAVVRSASVLLLLAATGVVPGCGEDLTEAEPLSELTESATAVGSHEIDVGLYWFGRGNVSWKAEADAANPFYDPSRPTVIYLHGWKPGAIQRGERETFNYADNDPAHGVDIDLADAWLDRGWNIGIFYWDQLSDEDHVWDAEAKIWSAAGPKGMRWRKPDGTYVTEATPDRSAAELFVDEYLRAMRGQRHGTIRLAGHSTGSQMAVHGARLLSERLAAGEAPETLLPKRIALLDPYWSNGAKGYLGGRWTGEVTRSEVAELMGLGVIFERYRTSTLSDFPLGDANGELTRRIGSTQLVPGYISLFDQGGRHVAAPNLYFHSFDFAPPTECWSDRGIRRCDGEAASASTSDTVIERLMRSRHVWVQSAGKGTITPGDNQFDRQSR